MTVGMKTSSRAGLMEGESPATAVWDMRGKRSIERTQKTNRTKQVKDMQWCHINVWGVNRGVDAWWIIKSPEA